MAILQSLVRLGEESSDVERSRGFRGCLAPLLFRLVVALLRFCPFQPSRNDEVIVLTVVPATAWGNINIRARGLTVAFRDMVPRIFADGTRPQECLHTKLCGWRPAMKEKRRTLIVK